MTESIALVAILVCGFSLYEYRETLSSMYYPVSKASDVASRNSGPTTPQNRQAALNIIEALPEDELCRKSLDGNHWSTLPILSNHVAEAQSRGLTIDTCKTSVAERRATASPKSRAALQNPQTALDIIKMLSKDELCLKATDGDHWSALPILANHVAEAQRRGLTIEVCKTNIADRGSSRSPNSRPAFEPIRSDAARLSDSEIEALRARLMALWTPPSGLENIRNMQIIIRINLKLDGTLASGPQVLTSGSGLQFNALRDSAVRAVLVGQPYTMLRPDHYGIWKEIDFSFDTRNLSSNGKPQSGMPAETERDKVTSISGNRNIAPPKAYLSPPQKALPVELPIDSGVISVVETHPFFADAPPVLVGSYNLSSISSYKQRGSTSFTKTSAYNAIVDWVRQGIVRYDSNSQEVMDYGGSNNNSGTRRKLELWAANGLVSLGEREVYNSASSRAITSMRLMRIDNMKGHIFPVDVGNRFSYELTYRQLVSDRADDLWRSESCEVTKQYEASRFFAGMGGPAYLVSCVYKWAYKKNKAGKFEGQMGHVFFKALGIWIEADPDSPQERIVFQKGPFSGTSTLKAVTFVR